MIKDAADQWCDDEGQIENIFGEYFKLIFHSEPTNHVEDVLAAIQPKISEDMNEQLSKSYTPEEVFFALNQMHPLKAPGPDGLPALFYSKFWATVKDDTLNITLNILNNGMSPAAINNTNITLIPKKCNPEKPQDFRPISLCNVIAKLITKCITNRLKPLLPNVISPSQSAFLPGRLITDNALIAFELFHTMKTNKARGLSSFALKLDMSKAYDHIEWSFLLSILTRLGFCSSFTDLIRRCISTVSYSVVINGRPSQPFVPTRGLRQGDPLSPYLFILCVEAFSAMLSQAENSGLLHGARVCQSAPPISHLFFVDDSLIFGRTSPDEIHVVRDIIYRFSCASRQRVNYYKSEVAFSRCISADISATLGSLCGVPIVQKHCLYLGLLASVGRSKKEVFRAIEERINKKLKNWKTRTLSQVGKLVLLKSVAQSIPSYVMNCFLLSPSVIYRINQCMARFWWGQKADERRIHWCKWEIACLPKNLGGLGLRDLESFNLAFLAKQGWKLLTQPHSLLTQCLKARYFPRCSFLQANLGFSPSFTWRSILARAAILKEETCWVIRDGRAVNPWVDQWVHSFKNITPPFPLLSSL